MKIREIRLIAFGPFTDVRIDRVEERKACTSYTAPTRRVKVQPCGR